MRGLNATVDRYLEAVTSAMTHMLHTQTRLPVCWRGVNKEDEVVDVKTNIDDVDCVACLRMLAKDAVIYGVGRNPKRNW